MRQSASNSHSKTSYKICLVVKPGFSERMLREHLSQTHDGASRRFELIDQHVAWIHHTLVRQTSSRILDLGCGPGLYLHRLAWLGHDGVGIDYSPASIAYARDAASRAELRIRYILDDIRSAAFGSDFDLAMLIWGEFNVFSPLDAERLLRKVIAALAAHGKLLLEVHTFDAIRRRGLRPSSQYTRDAGLFSDQPHRCIQDNFWHADCRAATTRYTVTEHATGVTTVHTASYQAYTDREYEVMRGNAGFNTVTNYPSWTGTKQSEELVVFVAEKQ